MKNRALMIFLILAFLVGILTLIVFYLKNNDPASSGLSSLGLKPSPTLTQPTVTPAPPNPLTQKGQELVNDLEKISQDLEFIKKPDSRLNPPSFYLEKEVKE